MDRVWIGFLITAIFLSLGVQADSDFLFCGLGMDDPWSVDSLRTEIAVHTRQIYTSFTVASLSEIDYYVNFLGTRGFFDVQRQVIFIVHGYWAQGPPNWQDRMKNEILKVEDSTVFLITWGHGADILSYNQAAANTQTVAVLTSSFAESVLQSNTFGGDKSKIYFYCIGHSLGAHVCGQAGRLSGRFDRVTGLDPAGPGFDTCWNDKALNTQSAKCVDAVHTDGSDVGHVDPLIPHFGTMTTLGHVDFYPNGGQDQPGCTVLTNDWACSHHLSIEFFIFSIGNPQSCLAAKGCYTQKSNPSLCPDAMKQHSGYFSSCYKTSTAVGLGQFYLITDSDVPYC